MVIEVTCFYMSMLLSVAVLIMFCVDKKKRPVLRFQMVDEEG